ncbi:hypothetical protein A33Q_0195 [Indibacter alkaliphilus LW1]|uniref:Uncharacterized protein n=1 Tax=Indibacter alkaliphilus (strain CCUG 57479 / KCTC 22604 / LW1) TaxID=1189612 RepID=S2E5W7_INDAL|nr:hypothetical protein A33Q_0195 [Indibacter alkaliphilus LW1]
MGGFVVLFLKIVDHICSKAVLKTAFSVQSVQGKISGFKG